jgi:hypothetical protein
MLGPEAVSMPIHGILALAAGSVTALFDSLGAQCLCDAWTLFSNGGTGSTEPAGERNRYRVPWTSATPIR